MPKRFREAREPATCCQERGSGVTYANPSSISGSSPKVAEKRTFGVLSVRTVQGAVMDPNVLISSRTSNLGHPARIARAADGGHFELILSEQLLGELSEVLMRPRFRRYATEEEVKDFLFGLREKGIFFEEDVEAELLVPDDPKDDYLVALTRASSADYLVSGDPHLAGAKNKVPVTILTPRQFSELVES